MNQKVSVILVNYNNNNDTLECIESLKHCLYNNLDIIVVDNASKSQDLLENNISKEVTLIKSDLNLGFSGGNNLGILYAMEHGADYVVLLNNDTVVEKNFVTELLNSAQRHPDAGIITGKIFLYSKPNCIWYAGGYMNLNIAKIHHYHIYENDVLNDNEREVSFSTGCLMMIPRGVINELGILNNIYFMYCEDAEYCSRILEKGLKIIYTPKALIYHKVSASSGGENSKLSQYYRTRNEMYLVFHHARHKILGCFCCLIRFIKRIVVGQFTLKIVLIGLSDLIKDKMGKTIQKL